VHVGRIDPSKNIDSLISTTLQLRGEFPGLTLTLIGESTSNNYNYFDFLQGKYSDFIKDGCVVFKGKIHNEALNVELSKYDAFLHDFDGSLDKTLVEAALVGLPVVTSNKEFIGNFLSFGHDQEKDSLAVILHNFLKSPAIHVKRVVDKNREIAVEKHSLEHWTLALVELLKLRNRLA
jgi:glycosyltransferase involved in cell wall biosynthesis